MEALATFIFWAALFFVMMRFGCGAHVMGHRGKHRKETGASAPTDQDQLRWMPPETDTDPVCGKQVRTRDAKPSLHDGLVYYFCSRECREAFEAAPETHLAPAASPAAEPERVEHRHG